MTQTLERAVKQQVIHFSVFQLIQDGPDEVLSVASSTMCNLLLEFSPSKEVRSSG